MVNPGDISFLLFMSPINMLHLRTGKKKQEKNPFQRRLLFYPLKVSGQKSIEKLTKHIFYTLYIGVYMCNSSYKYMGINMYI